MNLKKKYKKKFFKSLTLTLVISFIVVLPIFFMYKSFYSAPVYDPLKQRDSTLVSEKDAKAEDDSKSKGFLNSPVRTNVLITGVDKGESLTDVIMIASFISTTGQINLLSIPRDTYTTFSGDSLKRLRNANKGAPNVMKMNAVYSYTAKKEKIKFLQTTLEELLGIKIDYYVKVDLSAFKSIVDAVGGIYFDVPAGGLRYSDPTQNLNINLKGGYQKLNGKDAEGLVRFRKGYATQDLKRVQVQQEFVKEFIKQVLNKDTIISNLGEFILSTIKYVDTNFGISDLPKYIKSIEKINKDSIKSTTAPGRPQSINEASYYIIDNVALKDIVDEYFYGNTDPDNVDKGENQSEEN